MQVGRTIYQGITASEDVRRRIIEAYGVNRRPCLGSLLWVQKSSVWLSLIYVFYGRRNQPCVGVVITICLFCSLS